MQAKLEKNGGERYECKLSTCRNIFTTLALAKKHVMLSGHSQVIIDQQPDTSDTTVSDNEELEVVEVDNDRMVKYVHSCDLNSWLRISPKVVLY